MNTQPGLSDKKVKLKKKCMFLYMIYLCCYVSSRRLSDFGSTVTNCSCTLLIGHTEPKVLTLCMLVSYTDNICKWLITRSDPT